MFLLLQACFMQAIIYYLNISQGQVRSLTSSMVALGPFLITRPVAIRELMPHVVYSAQGVVVRGRNPVSVPSILLGDAGIEAGFTNRLDSVLRKQGIPEGIGNLLG